MGENSFPIVSVLLLVLVVVNVGAAIWDSQQAETSETKTTRPVTPDYQIITIQGMPCVYAYARSGGTASAGLSCNWDEWKGGE